MLTVIQLPALQDNYIYLLHDTASTQTAVIDPSLAEPVLNYLAEQNWSLHYVFNTHHHADHIGGNEVLQQHTNCTVIASDYDKHRIPAVNKTVKAGDCFYLGDYKIEVLDFTGHTLGHIGFYLPSEKLLFCGDTLFAMGCGRLFEGSAEQLWYSLQRITALPPDTLCYCAHEYTQVNGRFALTIEPDNTQLQQRLHEVNWLRAQNKATIPTTIALELATNPFLRTDSPNIQNHLQKTGASSLEIFTELRLKRNQFVL